ncbi:hypothetical protein CAPTEDRAFT_226946 [Capitella teleta]|uniref:Uncharacterized protein n=1 Tax=Capitella teleta TaxID=283909 RepID=R7U584_CAPTE|nr:hypothetical protein CAPTEDRAFT_226946 [Capitella teleta]|eukprot:ELT98836.1 hypothetical protein CAPTEDRAFT_226946 [Capitella teleta]
MAVSVDLKIRGRRYVLADPSATRRSLEDGVRGEGLGPVHEDDRFQRSPASQSPRSEESSPQKENSSSSPSSSSPQNDSKRHNQVKFPPHPPTSEPPNMRSLPPDLNKTTDYPEDLPSKLVDDCIPFSQEESSSMSDCSAWSQSHSASDSGIHSAHSRLSREYSMPNLHTLNQGMDMDGKFKQDILHGLEYFEQRNNELKKLNKKILRDLDRMTEANKHLEDHIDELTQKYNAVLGENSELKIQLDALVKEKGRYEQQAMNDWKNKVELKEKYVVMQNSAEKELVKLRERIDQQNKQLQSSAPEETSRQLQLTVTQLQDEIHKMNIDREKGLESHERLQREMNELQDVHRQKVTELEAQYKRFLSLKKSFNDLLEEHEALKKSNSTKMLGSSTWPSNKVMHAVETVHLIDRPGKKGPSYQTTNSGKILPATPAQNAVRSKVPRNRTDGLGRSENLPPVGSQAHLRHLSYISQ